MKPKRLRRRTALAQVALGLVAISGLTAALLGGAVYVLIAATLQERAETAIAAEMARIYRLSEPLEIAAEVRARVRQARDMGDFRFLYRFVRLDPLPEAANLQDVPASNFVAVCPDETTSEAGMPCSTWSTAIWPEKVRALEGWSEYDLALEPGHTVMVRGLARNIGERHQLVIARPEYDDRAILDTVAVAMAATVSLLMVAAGGFGLFAAARLVRRIDRLNEACASIGLTGISSRVPDVGSNDEFSDLAGNINAMLDRIAALIATLERFSDQVAHDLRTPLGRVRARLEGVANKLERSQGETAVGLIGEVDTTIEDIDQTLRTFEALLRIARIETGTRRALTPVDLAELAQEIAEIYQPVAEARGQSLALDLRHVTVQGDQELLRQALANLIDNALKYSADDGAVSVALRATGHSFSLIVEDNGPGIPADEREKVFERYFRGSGENRASGTGLGLSFTRAVCRRHDFTIALADARPGLKVEITGERLAGDHD